MRLLISLPYGLAFRNIVGCGVLDGCVTRGATVHVLLPSLAPADADLIGRELPEGVTTGPLRPVAVPGFYRVLKFLKQHLYFRRTALETFELKRQKRRVQQPLLHWAARCAEGASERLIREATVDRLLGTARQPFEDAYRGEIDRFEPDVVAVTKPGYMPDELPLLKVAHARGVRTISIDTTWDNMASKRPPYIRPDAITLWNRRMHDEAVRLYGFAAEQASITGGPQFDTCFSREPSADRREFLAGLGLDPDRPVLVFTLNNPLLTAGNPQYIEFLCDAVGRGLIRHRPNVVIRLHPWDRSGNYEAVGRQSHVRVERPFAPADPSSGYESLPTRRDVKHYGRLMRYADVVLNIASTTSLDAIATDTPVVNIGFDVVPTPVEASQARYYEFTHYRAIVESGAVRVAWSPDQLFELVNTSLSDPSFDRAARARARQTFLTFEDDGSAERVADAIIGTSSNSDSRSGPSGGAVGA